MESSSDEDEWLERCRNVVGHLLDSSVRLQADPVNSNTVPVTTDTALVVPDAVPDAALVIPDAVPDTTIVSSEAGLVVPEIDPVFPNSVFVLPDTIPVISEVIVPDNDAVLDPEAVVFVPRDSGPVLLDATAVPFEPDAPVVQFIDVDPTVETVIDTDSDPSDEADVPVNLNRRTSTPSTSSGVELPVVSDGLEVFPASSTPRIGSNSSTSSNVELPIVSVESDVDGCDADAELEDVFVSDDAETTIVQLVEEDVNQVNDQSNGIVRPDPRSRNHIPVRNLSPVSLEVADLVPAAESTHLSDTSAEYQDAVSTSFDLTGVASGSGVRPDPESITQEYDEGNVAWDPELVAAGPSSSTSGDSSAELANFDRGKEVRTRRPVKRLIETHMLSPSSKREHLRVRKSVRGRGRGGRGRGRGRGKRTDPE